MKLFGVGLAVALSVPFPGTAQKGPPGAFEVAGNIRGLGADSVVLFITRYGDDGKRAGADTLITKAVNDQFVLKGFVPKPTFAWAQIGGLKSRKSFFFFLEKGRIVIDGDAASLDALSFTGTPSNNDMTSSRKFTTAVYERIKAEREELKQYKEGGEGYKEVMNRIGTKYDSINAYELNFIKTHPASQVSSILLYVKQDKLPVDELETLYNSLSKAVKANDMVSMIPQKIRARRSVAVGNAAPDFTSTDTAGKAVSFSSFKGKVVLLEFWASWCVPCRKQSPHLAEMYRKYGDQGFTILQFSMDDAAAAAKWKEAIRKDDIGQWTQVSDLSGLESKVAKLYGVQPIPDNFLIDRTGKIVARGLQGEELENKLKETLEKSL